MSPKSHAAADRDAPHHEQSRGVSEQYLWHVTLSTGHTRKSFRHEVADDVIAVCRGLLARALRGPTPIPGMPVVMTAESSRRRLIVRVTSDGEPVVTFGVARHSSAGAPLWRMLTETSVLPVHAMAKRCPPEPWCAARLEPGIVSLDRETITALGDFERCIAWAWLG